MMENKKKGRQGKEIDKLKEDVLFIQSSQEFRKCIFDGAQ